MQHHHHSTHRARPGRVSIGLVLVAAMIVSLGALDSPVRASSTEVVGGSDVSVAGHRDAAADISVERSPASAAESAPPVAGAAGADGARGEQVDTDAPVPVEATTDSVETPVAAELVPLAPARLVDSRRGNSTVDGLGRIGMRLRPGQVLEIPVAGRGGVPASGASAAVLNFTAVRPSDPGHLTVFPCGEMPRASSANFAAGETVANEVIAKLSADGTVCVFTFSEIDLVVDVSGFVPSDVAFVSLSPARLVETRPGRPTVDGRQQDAARLRAGEVFRVQVLGRGGVPDEGVAAVAVNLTAVRPSARGHLTAFPCAERPRASSLNYRADDVVANEVIAQLSDEGELCVFSFSAIDLIVDVVGFVPDRSAYQSLTPARFLETRPGFETIDGQSATPVASASDNLSGAIATSEPFVDRRRVQSGETVRLQITGRNGIPDENVVAAVVNVTAVNAGESGHLIVFPCGVAPRASALNYRPGDTVANEVLALLDDDGGLCVFAFGETDLIADVTGYVPDWVAPVPLFEEGWRLEPSTVTFTEANEVVDVRLVHHGADGRPSGRAVPADLEVVSADRAYDVEIDGPVIRVRSGTGVADDLLSVRSASGDIELLLPVASVRVLPEVEVIDPSRILLPPPAGVRVESFGAFTETELRARTSVPTDGSSLRLPFVISGDAPPVGTIVLSPGSAPMLGRVLDPPSAPNIERGGSTLITVETLALQEVFAEVNIAGDFAALGDAGLLSSQSRTVCINTEDPSCDLVGFASGSQRVSTSPVVSRNPLSRCLNAGSTTDPTLTPGVALGSTEFIFEVNARPTGTFLATVNSSSLFFDFIPGFDITVKAGAKGSVTPSATLAINCVLKEFESLEFPVGGPFGMLLTTTVKPSIVGNLTLGATSDLGFTWEATSTWNGGYEAGLQVRNSDIQFKEVAKPFTRKDEVKVDASTGTSDFGDAFTLAASGGIALKLSIGVRLGGKTVEWLGDLLDEDDLGVVAPIDLTVGPTFSLTYDNEAKAVNTKKSGSGAKVALNGSVGLNIPGIGALLELVTKKTKLPLKPAFNFSLAELELGKAEALDGSLSVTVLNDEKELLEVGDVVDVEVKSKDNDPEALFGTEFTDDVTLYRVRTDGDEKTYTPDPDLFRWNATGNTVTGSATIDGDDCVDFGTDGAEYLVVGTQETIGVYEFPVYLGEFKLECEIEFEIDPETVSLRKEAGESTATVEITQKGLDDVTWKVAIPEGTAIPEGHQILFVPSSGRFEAETATFDVSLVCPEEDGESGEVIAVAEADGLSDTRALEISFNCLEGFIEIPGPTTREVVGGTVVSFESEGPDDTEWTPTGRALADTSTPVPGFLPGADSTSEQPAVKQFTTQPDPRKQTPINIPCHTTGFEALPESKGPGGITAPGRGGDSLTVVWQPKPYIAPIPTPPCPPPPPASPPEDPPGPPGGGPGGSGSSTGGGWGDPHIVSFDGLRYDAQTLGEYVYAEPIDGGDGPRLTVRHETFNPTATSFAASIISGVHIADRGVEFEVTIRPDGVFLDGAPFSLDSGESFASTPETSIERRGGGWRFTSPDIDLSIRNNGSYLDVDATVRSDGGLIGLLGIPDGDPSNDLPIRDPERPVEEWDSISLPLARAQGIDFYEFSDSWRLTDVADSPFTLFDPVFDAPNRLPASFGFLAPFREQARAVVAASQAFCGGDQIDLDWAVEAFAIELAAGNDDYPACSFRASGRVVTDDPTAAVEGIAVRADAPGLIACDAITDRQGRWSCELAPDPDDPQGDVTFPYAVDVEADPASPDGPAGSTQAFIEQRAVMNDDAILAPAPDLVIAADRAVVIALTGTLAVEGVPWALPTTLFVVARDGAGSQVRSTRVDVDPADDGSFAASMALPIGVASVDLRWDAGISGDDPTSTASDLEAGLNAVAFDADYRPLRLQLSGAATRNGEPFEDGRIRVVGQRSTGGTYSYTAALVAEIDGRYTIEGLLPSDVTSIDLSAWEGLESNAVSATLPDTAPGVLDTVFDVEIVAPRLFVSGVARRNGDPAPAFGLRIDAGGSSRTVIPTTVAPDRYEAVVDLPAGTTEVELTAGIGVIDADDPSLAVTDITDDDLDVTFDAIVDGPILVIEGTQTASGEPDSRRFSFRVDDGGGFNTLYTVAPSASGTFSREIALPSSSQTVAITGGQAGATITPSLVDGLVPGRNVRSIEFAVPTVVVDLSGTLIVDGEAVDGVTAISYRTVSSTGGSSGTRSALVDATDGEYSTRLFLPEDTTAVQLRANLGRWSDVEPFVPQAGLVLGVNTIDYDASYTTHSLAISGRLESDGVGLSGGRPFTVSFTIPDPTGVGGERTVSQSRTVALDFDGTFDFDVEIPAATTEAVVTARVAEEPADHPSVVVDSITGVVTPVELIASVPVAVTVDVQGTVVDRGIPVDGDVELDFELRETDGTIVESGRRVVTAVGGEFTTTFSARSATTELDVAWVVGLPGDALVVRTFDELAPGTNDVVFADVYDPPVVVVSGVVRQNGSPVGGDVSVDLLADVDGTPLSTGGSVTSSGLDGSYRYEELLPRAADTVVASISLDGGDAVTAPERTLLAGVNQISLDLDDVVNRLSVDGTVTVAGTPASGSVRIDGVFSDGDAQNESFSVDVTPDANGAYSFERDLPAFATQVTLTARLGSDDSIWPTETFTGLVPGQNERTFNGDIDVQVIRVSGDLTIGGEPVPDVARVTVRVIDETLGGGWSRTDTASLVDGVYSFEVTSPRASESARIIVELPSGSTPYDRFDQVVAITESGLNDLDVDVALQGRGVLVSGTLLDRGDPVTTGQTLFFDGRNDPTFASNWSGSISVTPDATGAFEGFFVVRDENVSVGHTTQIGPFTGDRVRQQTDGIDDGVNAITHDDDYRPPEIQISGTLQIDDVPVTENQLFIMPTIGNRTVAVGAGGTYAETFVFPRSEIGRNARISWAEGVTFEDQPTIIVGPLVAGANPATFDANYQTTTVTLSGNIRYRGEVPGGIGVNIDVFMSSTDGAGNYDLGDRNVLVEPDPVTGFYETTFEVASASEAVNGVILLDGFRSDQYETFSVVVDSTPGENTVGVLNAQTTSLELSGTVTLDGSGDPWDGQFFGFDVEARDGGVVLDTIEDIETSTDSNGDYSIEVFLPLGTDSVSVTPSAPGAATFTETITASPGVTVATEDFTTAGGESVELTMFFEGGVEPQIDVVGYEVIDYGFGPEEYNELSIDDDLDVVFILDCCWVATGIVDPNANFIEVRATYPDSGGGDPYVQRRVFDVSGQTAPYDLEVSFASGDDRFHLSAFSEVVNPDDSGDTSCYLEGLEFAFRVTVTAYPDVAAVSDGDPSNDVELFSTIVLPTGSQFDEFDSFDLVAVLAGAAAGYEYLIVDVDTSEFYDPDIAEAFYGFGYDLVPGLTESINDFYDATCVGESFE